jgi:hypothetical protein
MTDAACIVGRFYLVPHIHVEPLWRTSWTPRDGWVPTVGPKHRDVEHLQFAYEHYHIDWRFVDDYVFERASAWHGVPHAKVITATVGRDCVDGAIVLKRRKCRRPMPDFPPLPVGNRYCSRPEDSRWSDLESAHAGCRLKAGNICPHRGIDLTPFIKADGTAICPGHGLRWDTHTGRLLPHHAMVPA